MCLMRFYMTSFAILLALIAFSPRQSTAKEPNGAGHGGGENGNHAAAVHAGGGAPVAPHPMAVGGGAPVGAHPAAVGGNAAINPRVRSTTGIPGGQAAISPQTFNADHRPTYSGGGGGGDSWRYRWDNGQWLFWGVDNRWMWYGNDGRWLDYGNTYVVRRPILNNLSGGPITINNPAANKETLSYTLDGNAFTIPPGYSQDFREDRAWVVQFSRGANLEQARYTLQSGQYSFTNTDHGWELHRSEFPQTTAPLPLPAGQQ